MKIIEHRGRRWIPDIMKRYVMGIPGGVHQQGDMLPGGLQVLDTQPGDGLQIMMVAPMRLCGEG